MFFPISEKTDVSQWRCYLGVLKVTFSESSQKMQTNEWSMSPQLQADQKLLQFEVVKNGQFLDKFYKGLLGAKWHRKNVFLQLFLIKKLITFYPIIEISRNFQDLCNFCRGIQPRSQKLNIPEKNGIN